MEAVAFAALAEPSRLRIVELLRRRPFAVGEIAEALDIRQPQVSKHLRVLRDAGFVDVEVDARRRIYGLRRQQFEQLDTWVGSFEALWEARLDALDSFLAADPAGPADTADRQEPG